MRLSEKDITDFLLKFIDEGDIVLDVGCGDCSRLKELRKLKNINAFGIDISISNKGDNNKIVCKEMKAEYIGKLPGRFNLIFTVYSFHHFTEPERFLRNAKNKLLRGGILIIIDWKYGAVTSVDEEYYRASGIEKFLTDAGFKLKNKIFQGDTRIFIGF
ncbi:hypothetical protein BEH94_06480 [Candidatus Altiarchaeales archaeon WOR_SM1_SCG]|nr:hypothetical protein BEH94_06480 [Candidatus Altiarchaeales archaeon WOR_SM1_SCG]